MVYSQLVKENSKFQYSVVNSKARSKDYELALEWLKTAGVVLNCTKVTEGKCPVSIYEDMTAFKIYYSDIGLLSMRMELTPQSVIQNMNISDKAHGIIADESAYCIRSSANNFGFENGIKSIPLYALFCL